LVSRDEGHYGHTSTQPSLSRRFRELLCGV
jgi:hypothetical protein